MVLSFYVSLKFRFEPEKFLESRLFMSFRQSALPQQVIKSLHRHVKVAGRLVLAHLIFRHLTKGVQDKPHLILRQRSGIRVHRVNQRL